MGQLSFIPAWLERVWMPCDCALLAFGAFKELLFNFLPHQFMTHFIASIVRSPESIIALLARHNLKRFFSLLLRVMIRTTLV